MEYIYRHKTDKLIYKVEDGDTIIDITEDHSLFNEKQEKIKPSTINEHTKLEYYTGEIKPSVEIPMKDRDIKRMARMLALGKINVVPTLIMNGTKETIHKFMQEFLLVSEKEAKVEFTKTLEAQLQYLTNKEQD